MFKKTCVLIGGSTEFGQVLAKKFGKTWFKRWHVINVDSSENPACRDNFIVDWTKPIDQATVESLHSLVKSRTQEVDAFVNVVEAPKAPKSLRIRDEEIFDHYVSIKQSQLQSSVLMAHLAGNFLSPNGYVGFNGGYSEVYTGSDFYIDCLERIAHSVAVKQGLDLSIDRQEEQVIYTNAGVNVIFYPRNLITDKERQIRKVYKKFERGQRSMSELVKRWSVGD